MQAKNPTLMTVLALGITAALTAGQAQASGFQSKENSVKAMGRAFAGSGVAEDDASVVVNNPSAMTEFEGTAMQVDMTVIDRNAEFQGSGLAGVGLGTFSAPLTGGNGGDIGESNPMYATSIIHKFDSGLAVGAMISAPFGFKTEYDEDWRGRYFSTRSEVETIDLTLSAAYEVIPDRLSFGVGLIYERTEATLENAIDFGTLMLGAGVPGFRPQSADGRVSVHGEDQGFGYILSASFSPIDSLKFGLTHRTEIDHELEGTANFSLPASFAGAQSGLAALAANPLAPLTPAQRAQLTVLGNGYRDTAIVAPLSTPSVTTLSILYQVNDKLAVMLDYSETGWNSVQALEIDFDSSFQPDQSEELAWTDTRFMSIGVDYKLSDQFTLRGGYAHDETPTSDAFRSTRLPDADSRWFSVGLSWNMSDKVEINAAYTHVQQDTASVFVTDTTRHELTGEYSGDADMFGISGRFKF